MLRHVVNICVQVIQQRQQLPPAAQPAHHLRGQEQQEQHRSIKAPGPGVGKCCHSPGAAHPPGSTPLAQPYTPAPTLAQTHKGASTGTPWAHLVRLIQHQRPPRGDAKLVALQGHRHQPLLAVPNLHVSG
jgi:hypothetical protein